MIQGPTQRGAVGLGLVLTGFGALMLGWIRLRQSDIVAEQICFAVSGGIGGTLMLLFGSALVASSNSEMESQQLDEVLEAATRHRHERRGAR